MYTAIFIEWNILYYISRASFILLIDRLKSTILSGLHIYCYHDRPVVATFACVGLKLHFPGDLGMSFNQLYSSVLDTHNTLKKCAYISGKLPVYTET